MVIPPHFMGKKQGLNNHPWLTTFIRFANELVSYNPTYSWYISIPITGNPSIESPSPVKFLRRRKGIVLRVFRVLILCEGRRHLRYLEHPTIDVHKLICRFPGSIQCFFLEAICGPGPKKMCIMSHMGRTMPYNAINQPWLGMVEIPPIYGDFMADPRYPA